MLLIPKAAIEIIHEAQQTKNILVRYSSTMEVPAWIGMEEGYAAGTTLVPLTLRRRWALSEDREKAARGEPLRLREYGPEPSPVRESPADTILDWIKTYDIEENDGLIVVIGTFGMDVTSTEITLYVGFQDKKPKR